MAQQQAVLKPLRSDAAQEAVSQGDVAGILGERLQLAVAT